MLISNSFLELQWMCFHYYLSFRWTGTREQWAEIYSYETQFHYVPIPDRVTQPLSISNRWFEDGLQINGSSNYYNCNICIAIKELHLEGCSRMLIHIVVISQLCMMCAWDDALDSYWRWWGGCNWLWAWEVLTLFNEQAAGESSEGCCEDEPLRAYSWIKLSYQVI